MNNEEIRMILEAESESKEILSNAKLESEQMIASAQEDIKKYREDNNAYLKEMKKKKFETIEADKDRVYRQALSEEQEKLENALVGMKSAIEEIKANITKEILDKWLS